MAKNLEKVVFAGGCFWCMEPPFEKTTGVTNVIAGYTGGTDTKPTYQNYGDSGHIEAIEVAYDPTIVSYNQLLDTFWRNIDPTDPNGSFGDRGPQYRSAIFYKNTQEQQEAETSKAAIGKSGHFNKPIVTEILSSTPFYPAEEYHQDYATKNPIRYKYYRWRSGRDQFLDKTWGTPNPSVPAKPSPKNKSSKPSDAELRKLLTPEQYSVTQKNGTEPAFKNLYWDNTRPGIYVDLISGEPLFSSIDKYKSGTGWPTFTKPLAPENIVEKEDNRLFSKRTEIRSKRGDAHIGHLFTDGPQPGGLRYCMNSAALRFVPTDKLAAEGYEQYEKLFN